jgi:hypothetical protein
MDQELKKLYTTAAKEYEMWGVLGMIITVREQNG